MLSVLLVWWAGLGVKWSSVVWFSIPAVEELGLLRTGCEVGLRELELWS